MKSDRRLARAVGAPRIVNIADLRRVARWRLPRLVFEHVLSIVCLTLGDVVHGLQDREGKIADPHVGTVAKETWEQEIRLLLKEKGRSDRP